jgi:hypothetical protein
MVVVSNLCSWLGVDRVGDLLAQDAGNGFLFPVSSIQFSVPKSQYPAHSIQLTVSSSQNPVPRILFTESRVLCPVHRFPICILLLHCPFYSPCGPITTCSFRIRVPLQRVHLLYRFLHYISPSIYICTQHPPQQLLHYQPHLNPIYTHIQII